MNLSVNLGELTKPVVKQEEVPAVSNEEYEFSVESDANKVDVEQSGAGGLVAVEELDVDELTPGVISQEDISSAITEPIVAGPTMLPESKPAPTIFAKNEKHVRAYLYGRCFETVDTLVHILASATEDVVVDIYVCSPYLDSSSIIEVVGAIAGSKAKVSIDVQDSGEVPSLLFLTLDRDVSVVKGYIVRPCKSFTYTNNTNAKINIEAFEAYDKLIYDALLEKKILTEAQVVQLRDKRDIIFVDGSAIQERIK